MAIGKEKTSKITIYLVKKGKEKDILNNDKNTSQEKDLQEKGRFYWYNSNRNKPKWLSDFFKSDKDVNLFNQSSSGVLLTEITIENDTRTFVLTFGYGHSMIQKIHCEENFGLKLLLNIVDSESIRKIGKRTLTSEPKNTHEQLSKVGKLANFGIDIEQDLIEEITGKPKETLQNIFGKNLVTGKMSFTISHKINIDTVKNFLESCFKYYQKEDYKKNFAFIDQVKAIKDDTELNSTLITKINENNNDDTPDIKLWMAIPEIIAWEDMAGFSFTSKNENLVDDITYENFKESLKNKKIEDINFLKNKKITAYKSTDDKEHTHWSAFQCLYCEVKKDQNTCILVNGKWYTIAQNFVTETQEAYEKTLACSKDISLIKANKEEKENEYNERLANSLDEAILMDKKIIAHGGGHSSVEFCDVYDHKQKRFIHVKNYYGSSALSHLFAQGKVSGQLILNDENFRKKVQEKDKRIVLENKNQLQNYKIIFGIISKYDDDLELPFFSKVNFINERKQIKAFGFENVYLVKIQRENN